MGHQINLRDQVMLAAWLTPTAPCGGRSVDPSKMSATGVTLDGRKHTVSLEHVARFASWPTPVANDELGSQYCYGPKKPDGTRARFLKLPGAADSAAWASPAPIGSRVGTANRGQLNPAHSRWLMGFPPVWDACAVMAMPSSRKSRKSS
jgi:hypothetical protein